MNNTEKTLAYYNEKAADFVAGTVDVEFSEMQNDFLSFIKEGGKILDLGCGSGRDSKMFIESGYKVTAVDGSSELAKKASEYIGQDVICSTFQDFVPEETYDGIWACASLLHLAPEDIKTVMNKLKGYLAKDGVFYVSLKYGDFSGERNGRFFTDYTEASFNELLKEIPGLEVARTYITSDVRPGRAAERWLNAYLVKRE